MSNHKIYFSILVAISSGRLKEPFSVKEYRAACPGFAESTYRNFLRKHRKGNPGKDTELFERVSPDRFIVILPFKYQ